MYIINYITNFFLEELAIDLGTSNTLIIYKNNIVINEPSIIAIDKRNKSILAVGNKAKKMQGRTHNYIKVYKPLKYGVISDLNKTIYMIKEFINTIPNLNKKYIYPIFNIICCIPSGITKVEKKTIKNILFNLNIKNIYLIEEPMATAIGCGIDVTDPNGNMIINIGGGNTESAIISLGGIVCKKFTKIAGETFNHDIILYIKKKHNLYIGEITAERIKLQVGSVVPYLDNPPKDVPIQGIDLVSGKPKEILISYKEISEALNRSITIIEDIIMETLSITPPELASDIYNTGIYISGGGALLRGINKRLSKRTGLLVHIIDEPLKSVVIGSNKILKNISKYSLLTM